VGATVEVGSLSWDGGRNFYKSHYGGCVDDDCDDGGWRMDFSFKVDFQPIRTGDLLPIRTGCELKRGSVQRGCLIF
jgi:hypothetical protein